MWLANPTQPSDIDCRQYHRAREQRDGSTVNLQEETFERIISVFCDDMATTVTATYLFIRKEIYVPACKLHKHKWVSSDLTHLTKTESSMNAMWQAEEFKRYISENHGKKRQQEWKDRCQRKNTSETPWFWPNNILWNLFLESKARWYAVKQTTSLNLWAWINELMI